MMKSTNQLKQFRVKANIELYKELISAQEKLQILNFSAKFRKIKDVSLIKKTKKDIARILTIINEKLNKNSKGKNE